MKVDFPGHWGIWSTLDRRHREQLARPQVERGGKSLLPASFHDEHPHCADARHCSIKVRTYTQGASDTQREGLLYSKPLPCTATHAIGVQDMITDGMAGIAYVGGDICGFMKIATEELCARWAAAGAWQPFARNHHADGFQEFYL